MGKARLLPLLLLWGCFDLEEPGEVVDLRVLAVVAEPPEVFFAIIDPRELLTERPEGLACEPDPAPGLDPTAGASFDPDHVLCVRVEMDPEDFDRLAVDTRFGELSSDDVLTQFATFFETLANCEQPWPNDYTWFSATVDVDGVELGEVGIRK